MKVYAIECIVTNSIGDNLTLIKKVIANTPQKAKHNAKVVLTKKGYKALVKNMKIIWTEC